MSRPNRPAADRFINSLAKTNGTSFQSSQENVDGAQTVLSNGTGGSGQTVTGASGGGIYQLAVTATTTLSATAPFGSTSLSLTSATSFAAGAVIAVGPTLSASGGAQPLCEIQWVTAVSGSTVTITPGLFGTWASGQSVSVLPAITAQCTTAQSNAGLDLGTSVVASVSSTLAPATSPVLASIFVTAIRTYNQYPSWSYIPDYTATPLPGPQNTSVASYYPGNPSGGWSSFPSASISGTSILQLESGTPWFTSTLSALEAAGSSVLAVTTCPTGTFEAMVGDQTEPSERLFGTGSGGTTFTIAGQPTSYSLSGSASPYAICVDSSGNVYTANPGNNTVSKITSGGTVTQAWATLSGSANPDAICVDSSGNVYTADYGNNTVSKIGSNPGQTQFAHASGAQFQSVTSTGQSSWTFFPVLKVGNVSAPVTFTNTTLTIDPR